LTIPRAAAHRGSKRMAQITSLVSTASFQRQAHSSKVMQATIDRLLAEERFDIVQVESSHMAGFHFGGHTPVLLDEHNIEYELLWRVCCQERSVTRKVYNLLEYLKCRAE